MYEITYIIINIFLSVLFSLMTISLLLFSIYYFLFILLPLFISNIKEYLDEVKDIEENNSTVIENS